MKIRLIIIAMSVLFLLSCKSKPVVINHTKESVTVKNDCTAVAITIEKSAAIIDTLKNIVPKLVTGSKDKNCDSLCNAKKDEWLAGLNTKKSSGSNELGMYYDKYNNLLVLYGKQGETINELKEKTKVSSTDKSESENVEVPVKMPMTQMEKFFYRSGFIAWCILIIIALYNAYKLYKKSTTLT